MMKAWLGFGLVIVGAAILGRVLAELDFLLGVLGLMGYAMATIGICLVSESGRNDG